MGFFDKFKKKKKQEEADEEIISQTEAEQAEAADDSVPGEGQPEQYSPQPAPEAETAPEEPLTSDEPEAQESPEITEQPENIPQAEEAQPESAEEEPEEAEILPEDGAEEPKKVGFFEKLKNGLKKTKDGFMSKLELLMNSFTKIDEDFFDELEETLILSDIGAETSMEICDKLRQAVKRTGATDPADVKKLLREIIAEMLTGGNELRLDTKPSVIMVIGVNGAGKTTTIGKLAANLKSQGKKVIVAAADTFRAAAIDQLNVWTDRAGVDIIKHSEGSDPAAVVFDALSAAKARGADVVLCDTAGRLHNKKNLMEELKKIARVISREVPDASVETLLVLDATTGQNAVNQAKLFSESAEITGIVLTKLDGTAKGGIIIPIKNELGIPVKLVGVGEKIDDLQPFSPEDYVQALFE
ncbi:MAG TPA: signal recognition particle-docking protein FtsY [Ruminococcaceae bacterium]|nr:signal recognition particle-docking protein FtsY [Oscillospiraceae bacterium]